MSYSLWIPSIVYRPRQYGETIEIFKSLGAGYYHDHERMKIFPALSSSQPALVIFRNVPRNHEYAIPGLCNHDTFVVSKTYIKNKTRRIVYIPNLLHCGFWFPVSTEEPCSLRIYDVFYFLEWFSAESLVRTCLIT